MQRPLSRDASRRVTAACEFIRSRDSRVPKTAIILGSGLGGLANKIETPLSIEFSEIPGFARATASGHRGQLILGLIEGVVVAAMVGRFHRYEGWSHDEVTFPVYVLRELGAGRLIVSNAAGGVNPKLRVGDIVVICDHLDWMGGLSKALISKPQIIPGRSAELYDLAMGETAIRASLRGGFAAYRGTYLATLGPCYETRSEYRMLRKIGADVVGMSTIPEVMAANNANMSVLALSIVSNVANPDLAVAANHGEVLEAGRRAESRMETIVRAVLKGLS